MEVFKRGLSTVLGHFKLWLHHAFAQCVQVLSSSRLVM